MFFDIFVSFCVYIYVGLCSRVILQTYDWHVQSVISKLLLPYIFIFGGYVSVHTPVSRVHIKQIGTDTAKNISQFLLTVRWNKLCAIMSILVTEFHHTQFPNHWARIILLTTVTNVWSITLLVYCTRGWWERHFKSILLKKGDLWLTETSLLWLDEQK
jgi:hypothetical protein